MQELVLNVPALTKAVIQKASFSSRLEHLSLNGCFSATDIMADLGWKWLEFFIHPDEKRHEITSHPQGFFFFFKATAWYKVYFFNEKKKKTWNQLNKWDRRCSPTPSQSDYEISALSIGFRLPTVHCGLALYNGESFDEAALHMSIWVMSRAAGRTWAQCHPERVHSVWDMEGGYYHNHTRSLYTAPRSSRSLGARLDSAPGEHFRSTWTDALTTPRSVLVCDEYFKI